MLQLRTIALAIVVFLPLGSGAQATVTVCNEFLTAIHVAFANEEGGNYTAAGWWTIPKNVCQDVDFTPQGNTLYYTANSDWYKDGRRTTRDHWGNKVQLFVSRKKFNFTNAEKGRRGATAEMFGSATMTSQSPPKAVAITLHFKSGGTAISFKSKS